MKLLDLQESLLSIDETSTKEVDGTHILGKLSGQFFVPNGVSRNSRYYSKGLWEKTLDKKELKEKILNRRMFGTISHEQEIDDTALLEGKISHVVTKLYIDSSGKGMGEALILNTPTGRILNSILRAGCKLFVSSRADGEYNGDYDESIPKVDEDSYTLHSFDVVIEPGFLEANPNITEQLKKASLSKETATRMVEDNIKGEKNTMNIDEKLFNTLLEDNGKLKIDLEKALDENKKVTTEFKTSNENLVEKANDNNELKESFEKATEELKVANETLAKNDEDLKAYKEIGEAKVVSETVDKAIEELKAYKELGTAKEINEAIDKATEELKKYKGLGSISKLDKGIDLAAKKLEAYLELGTVEELTEALAKSHKLSTRIIKEEEELEVENVSIELEIPKETVQKFMDKGMSVEDIKEFVGLVLTDSEVDADDDEFSDEEGEDDDTMMDTFVSDDEEGENDEEDDENNVTLENRNKSERLLNIMESVSGKMVSKK